MLAKMKENLLLLLLFLFLLPLLLLFLFLPNLVVMEVKMKRSRLDFFEPDGFTSGSIGLYGNSRCRVWVCLCVCDGVCDAWVCTDHEIYVVAVIVAS